MSASIGKKKFVSRASDSDIFFNKINQYAEQVKARDKNKSFLFLPKNQYLIDDKKSKIANDFIPLLNEEKAYKRKLIEFTDHIVDKNYKFNYEEINNKSSSMGAFKRDAFVYV
jgi:hypothetical protein